MKMGLPTYFPLSASARQDKIDRSAATFHPQNRLTHESIDLVQNHFIWEGQFLPKNVLIVEARTSTLIALGQADAVNLNFAALDIGSRDAVFCSINDSEEGSADSGTHWWLLVGMEAQSGWRAFHANSSRSRSTDGRASLLTARLFGRRVECNRLAAAEQKNGYDWAFTC